jgi:hypothetical protein
MVQGTGEVKKRGGLFPLFPEKFLNPIKLGQPRKIASPLKKKPNRT